MPVQAIAIETLYSDHHSWLRGWLRKRLGNAFDAADLAHDTYVRIINTGRVPPPEESRRHLTQIANGLVIDLYRRRQIELSYLEMIACLPPGVRMVVAPIGLVNSGAITGAKIGTIRTRI